MIILFRNYYVRVVFSCVFIYHPKSCITAICTQISFHKIKNCGQIVNLTKILTYFLNQRPKKHLKTLKNSGKQRFVKNLLSSVIMFHMLKVCRHNCNVLCYIISALTL